MLYKYYPWSLHSRVHQLNHFPDSQCYVKREDELSCGISGSKLRKYASLIPYILENDVAHLGIIATTQSNNLVSLLQVAREYQLSFSVFLLKPWSTPDSGNYRLSRLMLSDDNIIWVERCEWPQVESIAQQFLKQRDGQTLLIGEGASVMQSLPGAMTLGEDICRNEAQLGIQFDHIFIDAGTGFSASALIKSFHERQHPGSIHVVLLADDEDTFRQQLANWTGIEQGRFNCLMPSTAQSFGAVNAQIKHEIRRMAVEEGILVDGVYSAKLFHQARASILAGAYRGNKLLIHSGGGLSLAANFSRFIGATDE